MFLLLAQCDLWFFLLLNHFTQHKIKRIFLYTVIFNCHVEGSSQRKLIVADGLILSMLLEPSISSSKAFIRYFLLYCVFFFAFWRPVFFFAELAQGHFTALCVDTVIQIFLYQQFPSIDIFCVSQGVHIFIYVSAVFSLALSSVFAYEPLPVHIDFPLAFWFPILSIHKA
ncbi:conserved hypothetical protein [Clostridium perfringens E str. JGS1987]|uniref:Uncharacterized protein n=1 Tax=Clostridium perfringens E str. JGS1987 TaxID=451755 RepID=B1BVU4_CLOPF|nr:conserved hypothetical protein [Clostridium perfringens E str. JGS1987]